MLLKILGALFFLGAIACATLAYLFGGPLWDDTFEFERMMHEAFTLVLGVPACLLFGFALMSHKKKPATP
jgi:hypothetical protein